MYMYIHVRTHVVHGVYMHGHLCDSCRLYLVEGLAVCSRDMLDHDIAVDEVGTDPGGVKDNPGLLEKHHTHHVVTYMTLLVHLYIRVSGGEKEERREMGDRKGERKRGRRCKRRHKNSKEREEDAQRVHGHMHAKCLVWGCLYYQ